MNLKSLPLVLNLIFSFIMGAIFLFYNGSRIPAGDEMGGILEFFAAIFIAILVFVIFSTVSILIWSRKSDNKELLQLLLFLLCTVSIYYSTWAICVYREPHLTPKETRELRLKEIDKTRKKVERIISKGDIYKPDDITLEKDTRLIRETIKGFFNKSFHVIKSDSIYKANYLKLLDTNIGSDSIETDSYMKIVYNSIDVDQIFYSPDLTKMLVFISFNETFTINPGEIESGANTLVLIGTKESHILKLYKFYHESCWTVDNPNKESAYYSIFLYLTNHGVNNCNHIQIDKKEFWKQDYAFKEHVIDNHKLYEFQIDSRQDTTKIPEYLRYSSDNPMILKPTFIINE